MGDGTSSSYEKYFDIVNSEFLLATAKLRTLVKHSGSTGAENETLVREFLKKYIPNHFSVGQGFAYRNEAEVSRQCDIIIYDANLFHPIFKQGDFVVVHPRSVVVAIEVKTNLTKKELYKAIENIRSVRRLDKNIAGLIFAYKGATVASLMKYLAAYQEPIPFNEIFELIAILSRNSCLALKAHSNNEFIHTSSDVSLPEVFIHPTWNYRNKIDRSFYLFFVYIMSALRGYIIENLPMSSRLRSELLNLEYMPEEGLECECYFDIYSRQLEKLKSRVTVAYEGQDFLGIKIGQGLAAR